MCTCILHASQEFSLTDNSPLLERCRRNFTKNPAQILTKKYIAKPHRRKGEIPLLPPAISSSTSMKSIDDTFSKMLHKKQAEGMLPQGE